MDQRARNTKNSPPKNRFVEPSPKRTSQRISFKSVMKSHNDSVAESAIMPTHLQSYMLRQRQPSNGPTSSHYSSHLGLFSKSFKELYTLDHLKHTYGLKGSQWGTSTQGQKESKHQMPGSSHQQKRVTFEPDFSQVRREQDPSGFLAVPAADGVPGLGVPQEDEFDRPTAIANSQSPGIMGAIGQDEPWQTLFRPQKSFNDKLRRPNKVKASSKGLQRLNTIQRLDPKSPMLIPQPKKDQQEDCAMLTPNSVFYAEKNSGVKAPQQMLFSKRASVKTEQQRGESFGMNGSLGLRQKNSLLEVSSEASRSMSSLSNSASLNPRLAQATKVEKGKSDLIKSLSSNARNSDRSRSQKKCTIRIFKKEAESLGWGVEVSPHVGNQGSKKRDRGAKSTAFEPSKEELKKGEKKLKKQSTMQMLAVTEQPTFQKPSFFGQQKLSSSSRSIQNSATFNQSQQRRTVDSVSSPKQTEGPRARHSTRKSTGFHNQRAPLFGAGKDPDVYEDSSASSQSIDSEELPSKKKRPSASSKPQLKTLDKPSSPSSEHSRESSNPDANPAPVKKRQSKQAAKEATRQSERRRTPTQKFDSSEPVKKKRGRKPKREITDEDLEVQQGETALCCSCANTACLKKYCKCFDNQGYCSSECKCQGCKNSESNAQLVKTARKKIMRRNPHAFKPKVKANQVRKSKTTETVKEPGSPVPENVVVQSITSTHISGCRCQKTQCLKNYCDCFLNGLLCNPKKCQCMGCKNTKKEVEKRMMQDDFLREFKDWIS